MLESCSYLPRVDIKSPPLFSGNLSGGLCFNFLLEDTKAADSWGIITWKLYPCDGCLGKLCWSRVVCGELPTIGSVDAGWCCTLPPLVV